MYPSTHIPTHPQPHPHHHPPRARKQLGDIFAKVIRERKARGAQEDDLLQVFIDAKYQRVNNGRATTEQECTGLMIAGLFAGQHTSSVVSSWTGYYMIGHKVGGGGWRGWARFALPFVGLGSIAYNHIEQHMHMHTYFYMHMHTYFYVHMHTYFYVHIHTYFYMHMHTYFYMHMHTYFYMHTPTPTPDPLSLSTGVV